MSKTLEKRTLSLEETGVEVRDENGQPALQGYPIVFNSLSEDLGGMREKINTDAFDEQLSRNKTDIILAVNHDTDKIIGRQGNDTLSLSKRDKGLWMKAKPNVDTTDGSDIVARVRRKDVVGMSFGFYALEDKFERNDKDEIIRTITKAEIVEVSPVTFPAYPATTISARALNKVEELSSDDDLQNKINAAVGNVVADESRDTETEAEPDTDAETCDSDECSEECQEPDTCEQDEGERSKPNELELLKRKRQRLMNSK